MRSFARVSPQRRTALVSIVAACVLIAVKLVAGIATGSLGLLSEAAHSGTDLVAALLTFFAVGVAVPPGRRGSRRTATARRSTWPRSAEAAILVVASLAIAWQRAPAPVRAVARQRATRTGTRSS